MSQKTKLILTISILTVLVIGFTFFNLQEAKTGTDQNVHGWAWSSTSGWISFNCDNILPCGTDYGVNIDSDGKLSGYAWSENVGWITFDNPNKLANCPQGPCEAKVDAAGKISGWARTCTVLQKQCKDHPNNYCTTTADCSSGDVCVNNYTCEGNVNINSGGWDGWISLNGTTTDDNKKYQTWIDSSKDPAEFMGWAWDASNTMGWISFNQENMGTALYDYKVWTTLNFNKPKADTLITLSDTADIYCFKTDHVPVTFQWNYIDPTGSHPQTAYAIKVYDMSNNSVLESCKSDGGKCGNDAAPNSSNNYTADIISDGKLDWGKTYTWQLMVWNNTGDSGWIQAPIPLTTIAHAYPVPGFESLPRRPFTDEIINFCSVYDDASCTVSAISKAYESETISMSVFDNNVIKFWKWEIATNTPYYSTSDKANPTSTLPVPDNYLVGLQVAEQDIVGGKFYGWCPANMKDALVKMGVIKPIPKIKEVPPL